MPTTHYTRSAAACQQPNMGTNPESSPPHADRRLIARYGVAALTEGYIAIPQIVRKHRRALGITSAEWDYICELWSYWRSTELPVPSVEALARGLGVDQSTIRRYRASLEQKGLLRVIPAGPHNRYDLHPLIAAAVGLDRLQAPPAAQETAQETAAPPMPRPRDPRADDRAESHASKEVEKNLDLDSIPPDPPSRGNARSRTASADPDCDDSALAPAIHALSAELGDDAPGSSLSRAGNLWRDAGVPRDRFLDLIDEAAARTRARQDRIMARGRDGGPSGMRYFFAVLTDVLHPAPIKRRPAPPDRRRTDPPDRRRRRREHSCGEPVSSYAAWSDSPACLPITEEHPVWHAVLDELALVLTVENFNMWLASTRVVDQEGERLTVAVPKPFNKDWLEAKLQGRVMSTLERLGYGGWQVQYVVEAAACTAASDATRAS